MRPLDMQAVEHQLRSAIDAGDADEVARLGAVMDRLEEAQRRPVASLASAALWYAQQGLHVFPLQPGAKVPYKGSRGCHDATSDEAAVRAWWERAPQSNIGIATGHLVDVIDVDGPAGVASWARMASLPDLLGRVSTPRPGGNHLYVRATGRGNKAGIAPGIDHRGTGGYCVAPPSLGADGTPYIWTRPLELAS